MKTWKLVSGILSIVLSVLVIGQSMIAGLGNTLAQNGEIGGSAGVIVGVVLLTAGIVSIATRNGGKGGAVALLLMFGLGALIGFGGAGSYLDLNIWSGWCLICAVMAFLSLFQKKKKTE